MAIILQNAILSFLRRQESRVLDLPGFRIKRGMTARKAANGEMERKIYINLKKQSQMPAFGWKSEAR